MPLALRQYTVYIDEAGDEGFGKLSAGPVGGQSKWLLLGACIVSRENDLKMPAWRDAILSKFPKRQTRELHFRNLKHEQKIVVCQEIATLPVGACVTLSHKMTLPGSQWDKTFQQKGYLYNYLLRWLLERVTEICKRDAGDATCSVKVVFSRRGNTDYQIMKNYMTLMRDGREVMPQMRTIAWDVLDIDRIVVENHSKWAGLQIADCITSAFFNAVEPNVYGNYESSYAKLLKPRMIKTAFGRFLNCGITPVPGINKCGADSGQMAFFNWFDK